MAADISIQAMLYICVGMAELKVVTREAVWSELSDPIPTQYTQKNVEKK